MRILKSLVSYVVLAVLVPVIAQATTAEKTIENRERAIGVCYGVAFNPTGEEHSSLLTPQDVAASYFGFYEKKMVDVPPLSNVELVGQPKHGKVLYSKYHDGMLHPTYIPAPGYVGDERIVFKVSVDGKTVKVVFLLNVTNRFTATDSSDVQDLLCKKTGDFWRISFWDVGELLSHGAQQIAPVDAKKRRA